MAYQEEIRELKQQIRNIINRNSDRGFVPYSGCNRVCGDLQEIMSGAERYAQSGQYQLSFDIYILVLLETVKLVSHADDSSGCCGDIIHVCLTEIDGLCRTTAETDAGYFFDTVIKSTKNKVFKGWEEWAYKLLLSAVYFVRNEKQAEKIKQLFPVLGTMFDREDYPEKSLISLGIIERLEGEGAGNQYLFANIHLPELRQIAVERSIAGKDHDRAEKLCKEALEHNIGNYFNRPSPWAYFLEQIYKQTGNMEGLIEITRHILFKGSTDYFQKLKALYIEQNRWEQERERLWRELATKVGVSNYAGLLSREKEFGRLLEVVESCHSYIEYYGKPLAAIYPDEIAQIFEDFILHEAKEATDRRKYKRVCHLMKIQAEAVGNRNTFELVDRLVDMYPRRPAMLDELCKLKNKFNK